MNNHFRAVSLAVCALLAVSTRVSAGDPPGDAQNKLLAKRAAEADCFRKLAETVYGVKINSDTYVRDFVAESDEIRAGVDSFVKGIRLGKPRYYDDGTCEVDAEVTVAKLVQTLQEVHAAHYKGKHIHAVDFQRIKETVKTNVIRVTGSGAPRPDIPDLPEGLEGAVPPPPQGLATSRFIPKLWRSISPAGRLLAERAARLDAMRRLLEEIKGLRLNSNTLVRDFITESDEISTHAQGLVIGASTVRTYLHNDELIAEVTMEVPVEKVFRKIKDYYSEYYHGKRVTITHIRNVKKTMRRKVIQATGSGVPPAKYIIKARTAGIRVPDWMGRTLHAVGEGTDAQINQAQGKLRAKRAAEIEARRKLAEQIYGLRISENTTVRDFVSEHDEITTQLDARIAGAVIGSPRFEEGTAIVRVSLPASDVWAVVHQQMLLLQRHGKTKNPTEQG